MKKVNHKDTKARRRAAIRFVALCLGGDEGTTKEVAHRYAVATDRQIDALVYELHGLTDDQIRIVEEATT